MLSHILKLKYYSEIKHEKAKLTFFNICIWKQMHTLLLKTKLLFWWPHMQELVVNL